MYGEEASSSGAGSGSGGAAIPYDYSSNISKHERMGYIFFVRETIDHKEGMAKGEYKVDIQARWCDCGKF